MKKSEGGLVRVKSETQTRYSNVRRFVAYCRAMESCSQRLAFGTMPPGFDAALLDLKDAGLWIETLEEEAEAFRKKDSDCTLRQRWKRLKRDLRKALT